MVVRATSTENVAGDRVGLLNKVFDVVYKARARAKDLKKRNRRLYYILKWLMIGALFYWLFIR